jgi:phosphatidylglycerophosphatase C
LSPIPVTAAELCDRLRRERAELGPAAVMASDGDGTLWDGDIADALFDAALTRRALREPAREALRAEVAGTGAVPEAGADANRLGEQLREVHHAGGYHESQWFAMQSWAFAGFRHDEMAAFARLVLDEYAFDARTRPAMRAVLAWAERAGVPVYLVSASPEAIVIDATRRLGMDPARVIAMTPAEENGVIVPRLGREATYGPGKVVRLGAVIGDAPLLAAFGDSGWDAPMMARARLPVTVAAKPSLLARLADVAGVLALEL